MRVCVVTVYNSINSGSFWQAFALKKVIENNNCEVFFYKRKPERHSSNSLYYQMRALIKELVKNGIYSAVTYLKMIIQFKKAEKEFCTIESNDEIKRINKFILGSDTIWDFKNEYFKRNYRLYWGGVFENKKICTYAASAANTRISDIQNINEIKKYVFNWEHIGVRDVATQNLVKEIGAKNINIVCDPTFLLTKEDYFQWVHRITESKYIFVYLFQMLDKKQAEELSNFASANNLQIINGATSNKPNYADKNIINSPLNFLSYMYYAEYIVTDTFHGTAFSINFEKPFIVVERNKDKVSDLLDTFDLSERKVKENEKIVPILKEKYSVISKKEEIRNKSLDFLEILLKK